MFYLLHPGNITHMYSFSIGLTGIVIVKYREDCTSSFSAYIDYALYALKLDSIQSCAVYKVYL